VYQGVLFIKKKTACFLKNDTSAKDQRYFGHSLNVGFPHHALQLIFYTASGLHKCALR